jgi:hypothetical protein
MATANGSGTPAPQEDDDPDRTQRLPHIQKVVDKWFSDDQPPTESGQPLMVMNRQARRMTGRPKQPNQKPTTASRDNRHGCWFSTLAPAVAAVLLAGLAVR